MEPTGKASFSEGLQVKGFISDCRSFVRLGFRVLGLLYTQKRSGKGLTHSLGMAS